MRPTLSTAVIVCLLWPLSQSRGDLQVLLTPRDAAGAPIVAPVLSGSVVMVDVLLSVDGPDDPLGNVTLLQFDLTATSDLIIVDAIEWIAEAAEYSLLTNSTSLPRALSQCGASDPPCFMLTSEPMLVARFATIVIGDGTINVIGDAESAQPSVAAFEGGTETRVAFSLSAGNLVGGAVDLSTFVDDPAATVDTDGDGLVDADDSDDDNDGVIDTSDAFPLDPTEQLDSDGDGVGDNADVFPADPTESADADADGIGDVADNDDDNDGVLDTVDAFPFDPTRNAGDSGVIGITAALDGPSSGASACGIATIAPVAIVAFAIALVGFIRPGHGKVQ